jgi:hypothetical protein
MNRYAVAVMVTLVSGCLCAQTRPKDTTWKGTLVDTGCRSSQSERQKTASDLSSYRNSYSKTVYGLMTADGTCIPLDVNSNEKVLGVLKVNRDWSANTVKIKPTKVEVTGIEVNGMISVDDIQIK